MADAVDPGPASHSAATQPSHDVGVPLKRTKVRKGTRSCWECKRRKIRCMFASPGDAVCIGCQHRLVPCVSQELPEPASPVKRVRRRLGERVVPASVDDQAGVPPYRTTREVDEPCMIRHLIETSVFANFPIDLSETRSKSSPPHAGLPRCVGGGSRRGIG